MLAPVDVQRVERKDLRRARRPWARARSHDERRRRFAVADLVTGAREHDVGAAIQKSGDSSRRFHDPGVEAVDARAHASRVFIAAVGVPRAASLVFTPITATTSSAYSGSTSSLTKRR